MANMGSTAHISEAEFGCGMQASLSPLGPVLKLTRTEHLAAVLGRNQETAAQFRASFMKTNHGLAPRGLLVGDSPNRKTPAGLLQPKYTCLSCSGAFVNGDRNAHMEKTGHLFCMWTMLVTVAEERLTLVDMESRNRLLFCQRCCDFVYDHALERLRSSAPKDTAKGLLRLLIALFTAYTDRPK